MPKKINEIGNIYNNLKVIERDYSKTNRVFWICECEKCHTQYSISGTDLRQNKKSCSKCELVGKIFGKLKVIDFDYVSKDRHKYWKCQCECGNIESIRGTWLTTEKKIQCHECSKKARKAQYIDETNNKYCRLKVLEYDIKNSGKNAFWKCRCECGNIISVEGSKLRSFHTNSCGCLKSKGEEKINKLLTAAKINYKTQITFEDCKYKNQLRFDFGVYDNQGNLLYIIEYDGEQHFKPAWGNKNFQEGKTRDEIKNQYCAINNIPLIRIPYTSYNNFTLEDLTIKSKYLVKESEDYGKNKCKKNRES